MNRIVVSAGALMMGVAGLNGANVEGLTPQQSSKWWSVSASLRGFYDDNVNQTHKKEGSPGIEFEPSFSVNLPRERTLISAKYLFRLNYYSERPDESIDQNHEFNFRVNHRFSERYRLNVEDSFVYSNEPEVVDQGGALTTFSRSDATGIRNRLPIDFSARLTRLVGVQVGYENNFYDYRQDGMQSRSAALDRMEHLVHLDGEWYFSDTTVGIVGYAFGVVDYLSDDEILPGYQGSDRSVRFHALYVGGSHAFSERLTGLAKVGLQYTEYYKLDDSSVSPYVNLAGAYTYLPGSSIKAGVKVERAATDLTGTAGRPTRDQLASVVYGTWTHRITPRITGQLFGQYQFSSFNGGEFDGETEGFLNTALTFNYQINHNVAATASYSFDVLMSDIEDGNGFEQNRGFTRNRVWAGVNVTY